LRSYPGRVLSKALICDPEYPGSSFKKVVSARYGNMTAFFASRELALALETKAQRIRTAKNKNFNLMVVFYQKKLKID
jgi:hypothetical protein